MTAIPISLTFDSGALPPGPVGPQGPQGVGIGLRVEDYGAVGDSVTNDSAAIIAAMQAAAVSGEPVLFGPKTYRCRMLPCIGSVELRGVPGKTVLRVNDGFDKQILYNPARGTTNIPVEWFSLYGIIFDGNKQNAPKVTAATAVAVDPIRHFRAERCVFRNATGYGFGLQSYDAIAANGPCEDLYFNECDFDDNGDGTGSTLYDGLDVKDCDRLTLVNCNARRNKADGFDFRGREIHLVNCNASSNGGGGLSVQANASGVTQNSSISVLGGRLNLNQFGAVFSNNPAGGAGFTRITMHGTEIDDNVSHGILFQAANAQTYAVIRAFAKGNGGQAVNMSGTPAAHDIAVMG
jgi:hypothetical protein